MTLGRRAERVDEKNDTPGGQLRPDGGEIWMVSRRVWVPLCVVALLIVALLGLAAHTHPLLPGDVGFTTGLQRIHSSAFQRLMIFRNWI